MKRALLLILLIGYLALIPSCFLSPMAPSMQGIHASHVMSGMPHPTGGSCAEVLFGHQGMFLSLTGIAMGAFVLALLLFVSFILVLAIALSSVDEPRARRANAPPLARFLALRSFIAWLALYEASPHVA